MNLTPSDTAAPALTPFSPYQKTVVAMLAFLQFAVILDFMLMAPMGARLAHRLPVAKLKKVFALILYSLAAYMLWKGLHG